MPDETIFSVGHSTHTIDHFIELLKLHCVDVVADVRSSPFSRFNPHFNKAYLSEALRKRGIMYKFFGDELGARVNDPSCYVGGRVQYVRLQSRREFQHAIARLIKGARNYRIALMCAEKEPLDCHRTILVSQALVNAGCEISRIHHIHADGSLEPHSEALDRLLNDMRVPKEDLFRSREEILQTALLMKESRIASKIPVKRVKNRE